MSSEIQATTSCDSMVESRKGDKTMPASKNKLEYINAWTRENSVRINLKLNVKNDADIIEFLESQDSKNAAIKKALREYMKNEG